MWPAYYVLAFVSIVEACLLPLLPSPPPPRQAAAKPAAESDVELDAVLETASLADTKARSSDAELSGGSLKPSTASKAKRLGDGSGWFYLGDPGTESLPRHVVRARLCALFCPARWHRRPDRAPPPSAARAKPRPARLSKPRPRCLSVQEPKARLTIDQRGTPLVCGRRW